MATKVRRAKRRGKATTPAGFVRPFVVDAPRFESTDGAAARVHAALRGLIFDFTGGREIITELRSSFESRFSEATDNDLLRAAEIMETIQQALAFNNAGTWKCVRRAHAAMDGTDIDAPKRLRILAVVKLAMFAHVEGVLPEDVDMVELAQLDERFSHMTPERLRELVAGLGQTRKDVIRCAANICLDVNALDDDDPTRGPNRVKRAIKSRDAFNNAITWGKKNGRLTAGFDF